MNEGCLPIEPVYGRSEFRDPVPKWSIPEPSMSPDSAYEMVRNELMLDARAGLNLATFVNTACPDPWALKLINENLGINFIDHEEYPASNLAEKRIIWMLAEAFGTDFGEDDDPDTAKGLYGSATIGSSEAVMLGLIAHKFNWAEKNRVNLEAGRADPQDRPVVLMSAHVHGCWDKFCRYYGAVPVYIPINGPPYHVTAEEVAEALRTPIDSDSIYSAMVQKGIGYLTPQAGRTIGELVMCVGAVVGSTFTGNSDPVQAFDQAVEAYCRETRSKELGLDIPIHVDAASASFVSLFSERGAELGLNFRLAKRMRSMNISNHKFGMTLPGMGSVIFRSSDVVPEDLVYHITYLGGNFIDYTVNFSRGAAMILMQYYNLLRFGREGYRAVIGNCMHNTRLFVEGLKNSGRLGGLLTVISDWERLPIVIMTWKDPKTKRSWDLAKLSAKLREQGWVVPSYVLPQASPDQNLDSSQGTQVLRVVVQQAVTGDKLSRLLTDMEDAVGELEDEVKKKPEARSVTGFKC
jgi:glutamate decarboxylase